jgi:hypothetical protein
LAACTVFAAGVFFANPARAAEAADPFVSGASLIAADQAAASGGRETWAADMPAVDLKWLDLHGMHLMSFGSQMSGDGVFILDLGRTMPDGSYENIKVFIDGQGTVLFRSDYDRISSAFSDGFMIAGHYIKDDRIRQPGELSGPPGSMDTYVDKTGRELIPPGSYDSMEDFHEGMAAVAVNSEYGGTLCGYLDKSGALAIPLRFKEALPFREGLAPVQNAADGLWGFIDKTGAQVIPFAYDLALPFSEGLAYVQLGGRAGYIDKENNIVVPIDLAADLLQPKWANPDPSFYNGRAVARVNTAFKYSSPNGPGEETTQDHLYGYIDKTGAFVIEPNLLSAEPFYRDLALADYANAAFTPMPSALIDRDGNRVTPFWTYNYSKLYSDINGSTLYPVWGFSDSAGPTGCGALNGNGAEVVPLRFYSVSEFDGGAAIAIVQDANRDTRVALLRETPASALPQAGRLIKIEIDGERLSLPDADPVIENDRTLVPLRYVFEALGAEPVWDEAARTVTSIHNGAEIRLRIDDPTARVNGEDVVLDAAPVLRGGRTLVPIRFIAESFGARVDWDEARRAVVIDTRR